MKSFNRRWHLPDYCRAPRSRAVALLFHGLLAATLLCPYGHADDKTLRLRRVASDSGSEERVLFLRPMSDGAPGHRITRGAFPALRSGHGRLNGEKLVNVANQIPIKGGNVVNVVYDATALRLWISYAKGNQEAYQRPYVFLDLKTLDADEDGKPDVEL